MGIVTVEQLLAVCKLEMERGNGNKQIYISADDEGNCFHPLVFTFTELTKDNQDDFLIYNGKVLDKDKHIILG